MTRRRREIFHLATESELQSGIGAAHYRPARLPQDGFVHCCGEASTARAVARDYFSGAAEPVFALRIDPARLDAELRFEAPAPLPGLPATHTARARSFPHVFGPIALRAISGAAVLERSGRELLWPAKFAPLAESLAASIGARLRALEASGLAALRGLRRELSERLCSSPSRLVIELATALLEGGASGARVLASELVLHHPTALERITPAQVKRLAGRLTRWSDVDVFACAIAGQALRRGALTDAHLLRWTRSRDRFWRRAALVATVPLNVRAQGGSGDRQRTLRVCRALVHDRDDTVVKALSWALRALAERDAPAVRRFLASQHARLAPRVLREVGNKLRTGLKNPRAARTPGGGHRHRSPGSAVACPSR
ncbi:MAG TPA: DUF952 domain-containing protein [Myxococcota bacterium]|nr:DUF952 domain-containing protein [Myxococcota bacterium]